MWRFEINNPTLANVFAKLTNIANLSVQLVNVTHSKPFGTQYASLAIEIKDSDLSTLLMDISRLYTTGKKNISENYNEVRGYDGTAEATIVYKLESDNALLQKEYGCLIAELTNPDVEEDPFKYTSAYIIKGSLIDDKDSTKTNQIILISCINPVTTLKSKFWFVDKKFQSIDQKVLNLRKTFDVVIINETVYFLTLAGETFFHMEHAYKNICEKTVDALIESDVFSDPEMFKKTATSKHNPRRFVSYSESNFEYLKSKENRKSIAEKFQIKLTGDEEIFDTSSELNNDRIVKLICNKGMLHPINENPMEVNGAKPWS